jgi:hypothetical protein
MALEAFPIETKSSIVSTLSPSSDLRVINFVKDKMDHEEIEEESPGEICSKL